MKVTGDGWNGEPLREEATTRPRLPKAVDARPVPADADERHPSLYFNRELSWLDFNWRVLFQATDHRHPLLERVRFVSIAASNLDEFFRKRVGGLKRQERAGVRKLSPDGRTPEDQLALIWTAAERMYKEIGRIWSEELLPQLRADAGVRLRSMDDLTDAQRESLREYFLKKIFPILTPLAVDPGHPFPFISNLSLSLAIMLRNPKRGTEHFARLKVPVNRGRLVSVPGEEFHFVPVEQLIADNIGDLFRGMVVESATAFRITRNADLSRNEEEADDLLRLISEEVRERRFASVVRLEVEKAMPIEVRHLLAKELELPSEGLYESTEMLDLADIGRIADLDLPDLKFTPWDPVIPPRLQGLQDGIDGADIFSIIRQGDVLVHHPYESFTASTQRFLEQAAEDPHVLAIKQTLYRTSTNSPVVAALLKAAERGKQVAVLVEVKARFDEENNIEWAQHLEAGGVHVTYGLVGLKTHAKAILVLREEEDGIRTYCHLGTGNYHAKTAGLYTDVGYLTCRPEIGADLVSLFHYLTGYAPDQTYDQLLVAPKAMRNQFIDCIHDEIASHKTHGDGKIIAKMNAMDDPIVIEELYKASKAGVSIDLIIRGHNRLRPGLPGFSENIRVISIIGRFLEHGRIYWFKNGGEPKIFFGSADWQRRNLEDRIETITPILQGRLKQRITKILQAGLSDNRLAWDLQSDGSWIQRRPAPGSEENVLHEVLMQDALVRTEDVSSSDARPDEALN